MLNPALAIALFLSSAGIGQSVGAPPAGGAPSAAVTTAAPPATTSAPVGVKAADADTVVCKADQQTGTRFPTRICHTKAQWAEITREARDFVNQTAGRSGCPKVAC